MVSFFFLKLSDGLKPFNFLLKPLEGQNGFSKTSRMSDRFLLSIILVKSVCSKIMQDEQQANVQQPEQHHEKIRQ